MSLEITNVSKSYPTPAEPLVVLQDVSLRVAPGQAVAILGPSGSGKSTLLHILGTLDTPTRGNVLIDGTYPSGLSAKQLAAFRRQHVGFIFQEHHLLAQCTALENVLVARLAGGSVRAEDTRAAEALLESVGLAQRATHLPAELSGGERQRVAIARALVNNPSLLLADEPTGNLDTRNAEAITDLLVSIAHQRNAMLVAVTHSPVLAQRFDRRLYLRAGQLVENASGGA